MSPQRFHVPVPWFSLDENHFARQSIVGGSVTGDCLATKSHQEAHSTVDHKDCGILHASLNMKKTCERWIPLTVAVFEVSFGHRHGITGANLVAPFVHGHRRIAPVMEVATQLFGAHFSSATMIVDHCKSLRATKTNNDTIFIRARSPNCIWFRFGDDIFTDRRHVGIVGTIVFLRVSNKYVTPDQINDVFSDPASTLARSVRVGTRRHLTRTLFASFHRPLWMYGHMI